MCMGKAFSFIHCLNGILLSFIQKFEWWYIQCPNDISVVLCGWAGQSNNDDYTGSCYRLTGWMNTIMSSLAIRKIPGWCNELIWKNSYSPLAHRNASRWHLPALMFPRQPNRTRHPRPNTITSRLCGVQRRQFSQICTCNPITSQGILQ